jgi:hypothetical protein
MNHCKFYFMTVLLSSLLPASVWAQVVDSLKIAEQMGVTTANYPIQLGRPFIQGEIANFPQAILNGTPVATQADVKQRWPDGSVKHAIISFLIPNLTAYQTVTVTFQNQASGNNAPLSPAQMLGANFNFDAQMQLTNGSTITADARAMLTAAGSCSALPSSGVQPLCTLWTSGQIAQTVILADHSTSRAYDIGFDANRAFRPIFQATFWPTINKVTVRFIGENAGTQALEDQTYALALTTGNSPATQVYTKASFKQSGATRWTKLFWIGGAPSPVAIDHNLTYIENTKFLPNYYNQVALTGATVANYCTMWNNASKDIGGAGNWDVYMPDAGARPDIGPFPDWTVIWAYTGNSCLQAMALGNADLAASWPVHLREGATGKKILRTDATGSNTGLGHVVSISGRPTVNGWGPPCNGCNWGNNGTSAADAINAVGAMTNQGWVDDTQHEPNTASLQYTLTGDFWYLEEMWFFAGFYYTSNYGPSFTPFTRGPTGAEGILWHEAIRDTAWNLRDSIETAFISPDGTPEQAYFTQLISDGISCEEGDKDITTTSFNGSAIWNYCRTQFAPVATSGGEDNFTGNNFSWGSGITPGTPTPLHQWSEGNPGFADQAYGICGPTSLGVACPSQTINAGVQLFETDYLLYVLGRAKELGFPTSALFSWLAVSYTDMLTTPGFNPYLIDIGQIPTVDLTGHYFTSYPATMVGFAPDWVNATSFSQSTPDAYAAYVVAGLSYVTGEPNGPASWSFMQANYPWGNFSTLPKWAMWPRGAVLAQASSCDLNHDGSVDASDVQSAINQTLGTAACTGDLVGTGSCTVVDVQRVINAALGGVCRLGQ